MDSPLTAMMPRTSSEAKADAVQWMDEYCRTSTYQWEWQTPTTLVCEPHPRFPCYVMAVATPGEEGGHHPSLAFTAGTKHEGRYWQGLVPDGDDPPGLSREALSRLDAVLGVLITASQVPVSPPN